MKKFILFFIVCICFAEMIFPQVQKKASICCVYSYNYIDDLLKKDRVRDDEMVLEIGKNGISTFYSYVNFIADSLRQADPYNYAPQVVMVDGKKTVVPARVKAKKTFNTYKQFIDNKSGTLTYTDLLYSTYVYYIEKLTTPDWKMQVDTCSIIGYNCQKATASYKGRTWVVWFTPDIPIGEGPWELRGLPGLILKAEDTKKEHCFECSSIKHLASNEIIEVPLLKEYKLIDKKDYQRKVRQLNEDFFGYLRQVENLGIRGESEKTKYNPLELAL